MIQVVKVVGGLELFLSELEETYVQLRPSPVSGVGVFAIRDIPKGCRSIFTKDNGEWIKVPRETVESLPSFVKKLVYHYCVSDRDGFYIERHGFKRMDLSNFINHSETPNISPVNDGEYFEAIVEIKCGEELLINYGEVATD